jgi:hypothetical protein
LVPVAVLGVALAGYAVDLPRGYDDVGTAASLLRLLDAPTWADRWRALFEQNNEHRVLFLRLFVAGWYGLTGQYSHVVFAIASSLCLAGVAAVFYPVVRAKGWPAAAWVPIPLLILAINQADNQLSVFGLQNFGVIFWAMLLFYALTVGEAPGWGYAAAGMTALSSGNGLLFVGIGLGLLAYQRRWGTLLRYGLLTGALAGIYFYQLHLATNAPRNWAVIGRRWYLNIGEFAAMATELHTFVPALQPALFVVGWVLLLAVLGALLPRLVRRRLDPTDQFLLAVVALVLGSGLLVAVLRGEGSPATAGRYRIYSALLLAVGYLLLLELLRKRIQPARVIAGAIVAVLVWFGLVTLKYWPELRFHRDEAVAHTLTWRQPRHPWSPTLRAERARLRHGTDVPPLPAMETALGQPSSVLSPVLADRLTEDADQYTIENESFAPGTGGVWAVAHGSNFRAVFPVKYMTRRGQLSGGFVARIPKRFLYGGTYRLGFLVQDKNRYRLYLTDHALVAPSGPLDAGVMP